MTGRQSYLNASDFKSARLKLLARTSCIQLKKYLSRMHMSEDDRCELCDSVEDLEHFLLKCPAFEQIRCKYFTLLDTFTNVSFKFSELSPSAKLLFLVGDIGHAFSLEIGSFYDFYERMYLLEIFNLRQMTLN